MPKILAAQLEKRVMFRLSRQEYQQLIGACRRTGKRTVSDLAPEAVAWWTRELRRDSDPRHRVEELYRYVTALASRAEDVIRAIEGMPERGRVDDRPEQQKSQCSAVRPGVAADQDGNAAHMEAKTMFTLTLALVLLLLPAVRASAVQVPSPDAGVEREPADGYVLGPGDEITIRSIDLEEISEKPVRVDPDGFISLPLVGRIRAAGVTAAQLEKELVEALQPYFRRPQASVSVTQFGSQPVTVLGSISSPGVYQLQGRKTLAEVLALAKGLTPEAGSTVTVTRSPEQGAIPLPNATFGNRGFSVAEIDLSRILEARDAEQNILILPHDLISVPRGRLVYVLGEVKKPGGFALAHRQNVSVLEALSMAEGFARTAAPQRARILRSVPGSTQRTEIALNLTKVLNNKEPNQMMEPDDILIVPNNAAKSATLRGIEAAIQMGTGIVIWRQAR